MYTLNKHKKRGGDGFKDFVKNLELFPSQTVRDMIFVGLLEDPVYLKWALENRISFDYFLNLNVDQVLMVYDKLNGAVLTFIMALKGSPEEEEFIENKLPKPLQRQYWDDRDSTPVSLGQQDTARITIMEKCFELEKTGELPRISWKMPPQKILEGTDYNLSDNGDYRQFYTNGEVALKGKFEKRLRAGKWEHFYPNGKIFAEGYYVGGEKEGEWKFFYPDGKIKSEGFFKDGKKAGKWNDYNRQGEVIVIEYKEGRVI